MGKPTLLQHHDQHRKYLAREFGQNETPTSMVDSETGFLKDSDTLRCLAEMTA